MRYAMRVSERCEVGRWSGRLMTGTLKTAASSDDSMGESGIA